MPRFFVSIFCILGLANGCDSSTENPALESQETFESQEQQIIAAQGGTLTLSDGASVTIPAGALPSDSKVVFSRLECPPIFRTSRFGTCPYEVRLESDLLKRAEVQLPSEVMDSDCILANTDLGWRCLIDSVNTGGHVNASFETSRQFTTNISAGEVPIGACTDAPFKNCGGDILGSWDLVSACGTRKQLGGSYSEGPARYPGCAEGEHYRAEQFAFHETMVFAEGGTEPGYDGSLTTNGGGSETTHDITTLACMATEGDDCSSPVCETYNGVCECLIDSGEFDTTSGRLWTQDEAGNYFVDDLTTPLEYCVSGDSLTIQFDHPDGKFQKVYSRKAL